MLKSESSQPIPMMHTELDDDLDSNLDDIDKMYTINTI